MRKLDLHLLPYLSFLYLLSYLDRSNISNVHDPLLEDLDLSESQYSVAVGVFYVGYIIFEIPANLILKRTNPAYWLGSLVVAWGICSTCMMFASDFKSLVIIRTFLGIAESGFFPGVIYYLSRWYQPREQSFRISLFYCSSALSGVISGLLAYGFLQMDDVMGLQGWQWLFLCEGIPSIIFGMLTWYVLPSSPEKVKWLTREEKDHAHSRLSHITNLDLKHAGSQMSQVLSIIASPKVLSFGLLFFGIVTPAYATSFYTPAIIKAMGYSTLESNLLSSPVSFFSFLCIVFNGWHADRTQERAWHFIIPCFIGTLSFAWLTIATYYEQNEASYAAMYAATASVATCVPLCLSWMTTTVSGSTQVATATALVVGIGNIGGIVGPNLYGFLFIPAETEDKDGSYVMGHLAMTIFLLCNTFLAFAIKMLVKPVHVEERDPLLGGKTSPDPMN